MYRHQEIQLIVEGAKNQRANVLGAAIKPAVLPIMLMATLSLVVAQFSSPSDAETLEGAIATEGV